MITLEDLKDFDTWKLWKNGKVELGDPEFEKRHGVPFNEDLLDMVKDRL